MRRSAKSDAHFVREKEWQAAQSVLLWVDEAQSMDFASTDTLPTKADRARLLTMAVSILLIRAGEARGAGQSWHAAALFEVAASAHQPSAGLGRPRHGLWRAVIRIMPPQSRALFVSDFMGPLEAVEAQLTRAADRGVKGTLYHILDPAEEAFPYDGRTIFESIGGSLSHETLKAGDLRGRYLERLAERKARLDDLARVTGWQYGVHHTDSSAQSALLWIYNALERRR